MRNEEQESECEQTRLPTSTRVMTLCDKYRYDRCIHRLDAQLQQAVQQVTPEHEQYDRTSQTLIAWTVEGGSNRMFRRAKAIEYPSLSLNFTASETKTSRPN
jgi:hypothetical protein